MTHRVRNVGGVLLALAIALPAHAATTDVRGAWRAQEDVLAEGERHPVEHAYQHLEPLALAYSLMTRSWKIDRDKLRMRDQEFVARYEALRGPS